MKITSRLILAEDKLKKGFQPVNLKMLLPSGEAKNNSVLGPLLGQHQINIVSFCNDFNSKSVQLFEQGIFLPVFVSLKKDKTYAIVMKNPSLSVLLYQVETSDKVYTLEGLFDCVKILSFFLDKSIVSVGLLVFGYLSSNGLRRKISIT